MTNASAINLSTLGLGATFNDTTIINGLVGVAQQPLTNLQTQETNVQGASSTITAFVSKLSALQTAAKALSDPTQYSSYTATSSNPAIVATTNGAATPGTYSLQVTALAQAQRTYGTPQASNTAALGMSGTLTMSVGGQPYPVTITATDSLATIATKISAAGGPVSASVFYDGSQYRLQVQGLTTGKANAITFNESGFSLGLSNPANTYLSAQDASATVDGIPVTSSTNQLTGAVPGVSIALASTTTSPATLTVASDSSALSQKIQTFVTDYNAVIAAGHAAAGYGTTAASNSYLTADQGISTTLRQLANLVTAPVAGAHTSLQTLDLAGITLKQDGTLAFDSTKLASAISSDATGVQRLFVTDPTSGATGMMGTLSTLVDSLGNNTTSPLQSEIQGFATRLKAMQTRATAMQVRITQYTTQLQKEFSNMDSTVTQDRNLWTAIGGTGTFL